MRSSLSARLMHCHGNRARRNGGTLYHAVSMSRDCHTAWVRNSSKQAPVLSELTLQIFRDNQQTKAVALLRSSAPPLLRYHLLPPSCSPFLLDVLCKMGAAQGCLKFKSQSTSRLWQGTPGVARCLHTFGKGPARRCVIDAIDCICVIPAHG
jgi:hypothetical protein